MALVDVKLDDKVELTLTADENDFIYILRQVAGGGFSITDYKIKVSNLLGTSLGYATDGVVPTATAGTTYFNTTDDQMRGYDGADWHNLYNNVFNVKVSLTAAEIKTLGTTPISLIPAQGAGTIIQLLEHPTISLNYGTVSFDNNPLLFNFSAASVNLFQSLTFINQTSDRITLAERVLSSGSSSIIENAPLLIGGTDSVATGDSTIDIYLTYQVITL